MKVYVGQTRSRSLIERLSALGWGECTVRGELPPRRRPFFYDNGAFRDWKAGIPWDEAAFVRDLAGLDGPDFVVAPDIVGDGLASLALSSSWVSRLIKWPVYLAVQDGMTEAQVELEIGPFSGLFVGGSLEWKLSTGYRWARLAHSHNRPCHIGRVGTPRHVDWAFDVGADSIDSCTPLWAEANLERFRVALNRPEINQRKLFA